MKSQYIHQLPSNTQSRILSDLQAALSNLNLSPEELTEAIESSLNSKLIDLQETIDINKYLQ